MLLAPRIGLVRKGGKKMESNRRCQVTGWRKATGFADRFGYGRKDRDVGNISFLSDISPGDQDQLNNLVEPVKMKLLDILFNKH